jgi:SAM-dependent methyltransferase
VGAGTGILTRALVEAGVSVIAIEPVEEMRRALVDDLPGVVALSGTAEDLPLDDGSVGTIVAAQAAHWFRYPQCLDEFTRVLRPAGHLVTVWNVRDETVPWVRAYTEAIAEFEGDTPRYRTMAWRRAIDGDARFAFVEELAAANPQPTTVDGVVERALSTSFIASLAPTDKLRLEARLREIVAPLGPAFDYPYRSELQAWRLNR